MSVVIGSRSIHVQAEEGASAAVYGSFPTRRSQTWQMKQSMKRENVKGHTLVKCFMAIKLIAAQSVHLKIRVWRKIPHFYPDAPELHVTPISDSVFAHWTADFPLGALTSKSRILISQDPSLGQSIFATTSS